MSVLRAQHLGGELCVNAARASFSVSTGAGRGGAVADFDGGTELGAIPV